MPDAPTEDRSANLATSLTRDIDAIERELKEIDMLAGQARTEATRHEQKRAQIAERLATAAGSTAPDVKEIVELNGQLAGLTRRAAMMEAQIDILEGKRRILGRYRDGLVRVADALRGLPPDAIPAAGAPGDEPGDQHDAAAASPAAVNRLVQAAQEDLRRDISRAMHDGPAQSLTNIVLQAQIVDRLLERDPERARSEVRDLVAMVQRTLDATKTFIFDVRPMVLDDLGLVPTLRRMARDRSRQTEVPTDFDSLGQDRRLPGDLESGVYRIVDETLAALAVLRPDSIGLRLDWAEAELEAHVSARFPAPPEAVAAEPVVKHELPPMLATFMQPRREAPKEVAAPPGLPDALRRDLADRAASIGALLAIDEDGRALHLRVPLTPGGTGTGPA